MAILGLPNAGKSTLVNSLVGSKVTIVSPKVQTTRTRLMGVFSVNESQVVLVDTPGIIDNPKRRLERSMTHEAWQALSDAEEWVFLIDAKKLRQDDNLELLKKLEAKKRSFTLVFNKVDAIKKEKLLSLVAQFHSPFITQVFMISALSGSGLDDLKKSLVANLPEGEWLFPEGQVSNLPKQFQAAEITREYLFKRLQQEIPYALWVEPAVWEERKDGSVVIEQIIHLERDSQKAIVLGQGGQQIKAVGMAARKDLINIFGHPVHLLLSVKVSPRWIEDARAYRLMGLEFKI